VQELDLGAESQQMVLELRLCARSEEGLGFRSAWWCRQRPVVVDLDVVPAKTADRAKNGKWAVRKVAEIPPSRQTRHNCRRCCRVSKPSFRS